MFLRIIDGVKLIVHTVCDSERFNFFLFYMKSFTFVPVRLLVVKQNSHLNFNQSRHIELNWISISFFSLFFFMPTVKRPVLVVNQEIHRAEVDVHPTSPFIQEEG